ncbi:glycosyl hydrolase family 65 protein [Saccharomonospora xinjiangensis]|uniref:glycoside hydrolase family 65 protein n=1 Tax=Saccharomonospora xinjiangensis TaxID=75294 RepID=UPI00106FFEB4|nr:glycosyl hydrolase family 65 protein [Saccharomonospora xinjiangensis]QBQ61253.1 putative glycosyl hydrolase [Saccharomonospora xinjiangensis]
MSREARDRAASGTSGDDERVWRLTYSELDPQEEGRREALCTLGNGYFATRGAAPESHADGVHYPGTYVAGCYNRLRDVVDGRVVDNESLVNLPNWLPMTFRVGDGPWFGTGATEVVEHHQELDLKRGLLLRRLLVRDPAGNLTSVTQRRFVHMELPHLAGLETTLVAENWSGPVTVRSGIDGGVHNGGVARYRHLDGHHLTGHRADEPSPDVVRIEVATRQSDIRVATAARTRCVRDGSPAEGTRRLVRLPEAIAHEITLDVGRGGELRVEKIAAIHTSRDPATDEPGADVLGWLDDAAGFDRLADRQAIAWSHLWERFDFDIDNAGLLRIIRLHVFHLLQTLSPHTVDLDTGIPARGLHGEAYRGHVFWDELFVFPVINLRLPVLARALLRYRHRRLPRARHAARAAGHPGAMYPWQSGGSGAEESPQLHVNPLSQRWIEDPTHRQRHIGLAVAYNVWQHYQATGDTEFLIDYGAEMMLEIAAFFASLASFDQATGRYSIRGVMGPDEFHTGYPGRDGEGIDDNAYTNVMAAWLFRRTADVLDSLAPQRARELREKLEIEDADLRRWDTLSRRLAVPFHGDGVISQFDGYAELAELDWAAYRARYGNIRRLDRILEAEGDNVNRYQASKQADVLMLFYLFSADELGALLHRLGYELRYDTIPRTIEYYLARTSHGSTLSAVVHAWVLARANRPQAMELFVEALNSDLADVQGGTTAEGIHLAAMAGTVDLLQRCFTGLETTGGTLRLNPQWPRELGPLRFSLRYQHNPITLHVAGRNVTVEVGEGGDPFRVSCGGDTVTLRPGETAEFTVAGS